MGARLSLARTHPEDSADAAACWLKATDRIATRSFYRHPSRHAHVRSFKPYPYRKSAATEFVSYATPKIGDPDEFIFRPALRAFERAAISQSISLSLITNRGPSQTSMLKPSILVLAWSITSRSESKSIVSETPTIWLSGRGTV